MKQDPIAVVEACYDLRASEGQWLRGIAESIHPLMPPGNMGVLAYNVTLTPERGVQFGDAVQHAVDHDVVSGMRDMGRMAALEKVPGTPLLMRARARVYRKLVEFTIRTHVDHLLLSEMPLRGPRWMYAMGSPGVRDILWFSNHHIDGLGATVVGSALSQTCRLHRRQRQMIQMLSAHMKAGRRLRMRLRQVDASAVALPPQGAILRGDGQLLDAHGEAAEKDYRAALEQAARAVESARTTAGGRDERALEVWQGLVSGRWSLVERFDSDGQRFLIAHRNAEDVVDPRGLGKLEVRVCALAIRGFSNKLIGYHLGISEGSVASALSRALRKLGLSSRVELVRVLGVDPAMTGPESH